MITLFSIPKPFEGHIGVIQTNAIRSWTRLNGCEVILFGEERGVAEAAVALGVRHAKDVGRNSSGTPLVSDAFEQACNLANKPLIAYVNADIILTNDFVHAAQSVSSFNRHSFLMVGQRHDIDISEPLEFCDCWEQQLKAEVMRSGTLHGKAGIDYFLFPRDFPVRLPSFAVGRPGWDGWLIYRARFIGIPLIDASDVVMAVHQNHPPLYKYFGNEARDNAQLAGGYSRMGTLRDANWRLTSRGLQRFPIVRRLVGALLFSACGRMALAAKRTAQSMIARRDMGS